MAFEDLSDLKPAKQVYYAINTPLFSDYAEKERFINLPTGKKMEFRSQGPFDFPDGAVLIKNFYYNTDRTEIYEQRKILETRLLIKENEKWSPLTYIWNTAQSDAYLNVVGKTQHVNWIDKKGEKWTMSPETNVSTATTPITVSFQLEQAWLN